MSEYRRFVAYIYGYADGKKNKNTGFAKVESRNGICRMQICLQRIPQEEKALNVYGFVREGGWLLGILLGQLSRQGAGAGARIQTPAQKIGGSGYALSQLAGLWIEGSQGKKYLTVFDDEAIDTEKLVTELPEKNKKADKESVDAKRQKPKEPENKSMQEAKRVPAETAGTEPEERADGREKGAETAHAETAEEVREQEVREDETGGEERHEEAETAEAGKAQEINAEAGKTETIEETGETEERSAEVNHVEERAEASKETKENASYIEEKDGEGRKAGELNGKAQKAVSQEKAEAANAERAGEPLREIPVQKVKKISQKSDEEETAQASQKSDEEKTAQVPQKSDAGKANQASRESDAGKANQVSRESDTGKANQVSRESDAGKANQASRESDEGNARPAAQRLRAQEAAPCPAPGFQCRDRHPCSMGMERKWQVLSSRCPHFRPFSDGEMADCIQITPRELSFIQQGNCRMGNNSFLMHGFCNYRHLLFAKRRDGGYILGIPGIFENRELFMANMFGFPDFKEASSRHPRGRFGYWCRRL